ncbi:MAG: hypothetical protein KIS76_03895 [Pyrinomonadaceae bacterium]|nr:hypothetical protein [Pyrinomonadaceae bacterium]
MAKKKPAAEQSLERMKAANDRIRTRVSAKSETDISFKPLGWWRENWHSKDVQKQFIENFIYIRDAFDENKLTLLKFNDIQNHLHFNCTGKDIVIKSRRQGLSTFFKARFFAKTVVMSGRNFREVPHDPDTEAQFRADFRVMYENLPPHLKPQTKYYSEDLIEFKDAAKGTINSRVSTASVQPGHEGKGRGQTITDLHLTEPPFWRGDAKKAATSLLEAAQGGDVAVESTPFGIDWTHQVYNQGKKGEAGWKSFFFEWWWKREYRVEGAKFGYAKGVYFLLKPDESLKEVQRNASRLDAAKVDDDEQKTCELILAHLKSKNYAPQNATWVCREVAEYLAWRRAKIEELAGGLQQFKVEYPENDRDCFEQTGRPVIQARYLKVSCDAQEPVEGREYLIGADTSLGLEHGDYSAIEILDLLTGRQVFSEQLKRSPDLLAHRLAELSDRYNWAMVVVERNNTGIAAIRELQKLIGEERIFKYLDRRLQRAVEDAILTIDEAMDKAEFGLPTTGANKGEMAVFLEQAVRTGELGLSNREWCEQAKTVVWFDNGKWGALSGYHDDRFMALAIANYVRMQLIGQRQGLEVLPVVGDAR